MLGPVIERLQSELHDPTIDRTFAIMLRAGMLPPPPQEIQGMNMKVDYISTLAQAQKMVGTQSIEETIAFAGNVAQVMPTILDNIDYDDAIREYAEMKGVPPTMMRTQEELQAIREQRAKEQQARELAAAMPQMAESAKTLSETQVNGGNALDAVMGNKPQPAMAGQK